MIWAPNNAPRLLLILKEDLKVGPALSRMIVGALRDHQLIKSGKSDFKPDLHVCRQMHRLGLSPTSKVSDVLTAADKYFPDPWLADTALFYLGVEFDITGQEGLLEFHRQMTAWREKRSDIAAQVRDIRKELLEDLGKDAWEIESESSLHWIGLYLARTDGPLRGSMHSQDRSALWAWIGIGFYGELVSGIQVGGEAEFFTPPVVRQKLRKLKFVSGEESRDPFSNRTSFWQQNTFPQPGKFQLRQRFKQMAERAQCLLRKIEEAR